jgi:hypothetical protein
MNARQGGSPCTLEEFADRHGLTMVVRERRADMGPAMRFYADGSLLVGTYGDGPTPEAAIADYALEIRGGRRLVYGAWTHDRREFETPYEWEPSK